MLPAFPPNHFWLAVSVASVASRVLTVSRWVFCCLAAPEPIAPDRMSVLALGLALPNIPAIFG